AENHVVSVASGSNGNAAYAYDGAGQRVKKTVNGTVVTVFVYDAAGRLAAEYGPGDGKPGTQYPTGDHLGSVRVTTDAAGNVVRRHDYRPFGQDLSGINGRSAKYVDTKNVPRFTGKERDSETGLDFFGARYFSSAQGRFTSPDWSAVPQPVPYADLSDPQTLNLYSYVRNNPLRKADPDGHCGLIGDSDCTISQFVASLPDRLAGGLKFEANAALEMVGVGPKFTASNAEQADAMQSGEDIKPLFQTGLAMVIPGPKGLKGEAGAIEGEAAAGGRFSGRYADGEKAYRTNVPRDPVTNEPTPLPGASGPHSRLQPDAKNPGRTYSATEFDANGKAVKRTDFAGRKGDQLPHQHEYDPATKGFKEKKPLDQQ
ncbi:MAG: RHS repeat-associated core domain-containing protein, partial [Bryobacteraceae bacterium]